MALLDACVRHIRSSAPPFDVYELQFDVLERRLGPVKQAAAHAASVEIDQPTKRLAAGLQQLADRAAAL